MKYNHEASSSAYKMRQKVFRDYLEFQHDILRVYSVFKFSFMCPLNLTVIDNGEVTDVIDF